MVKTFDSRRKNPRYDFEGYNVLNFVLEFRGFFLTQIVNIFNSVHELNEI